MIKIKTKIVQKKASQIMERPSNFLTRKRVIEHMEVVYLPYYYFDIEITFSNEKKTKRSICVDAIDGDYAFIEDNSFIINSENTGEKETNVVFNIGEDAASSIARKAIKDIVIMRMKKGINVNELKCNLIQMIKYPYWIGLYRKRKKIEFDALDAITGQKQGAKMRPVLLKLIMQ